MCYCLILIDKFIVVNVGVLEFLFDFFLHFLSLSVKVIVVQSSLNVVLNIDVAIVASVVLEFLTDWLPE